jgi:PAS domain S-box-containing protein
MRDDDPDHGARPAPNAEELWRSLVESSPDFIFTADLSGRIDSLNRATPGTRVEKVVGLNVLDFAPPGARAEIAEVFAAVRRTGEPRSYDGAGLDAQGRLTHQEALCVPVKRAGEVVAFLVVSRDVTARRRAQQALRESEERFRAMIERSADGIALTDAAGTILYNSPAVERILGFRPQERTGRSAFELVHPDDRKRLQEQIAALLAHPGDSLTTTLRLKHRDGRTQWLESVITNLLEVPGVQALVGNYRDVTERIRLEEQLRQSQKMEAIGLLAGGIAHDFNNLLTAILGFTESARAALAPGEPAAQDLANVSHAARSAADLTQKLLTFARRKVLRVETFDVRDLLSGFGELIGRIVGEDVVVEISPPAGPLLIKGDLAQLQQLLLNLCTNARQAMPAGGRLTMRARRAGGWCELVVSDTGVGMGEETRRRIFEPFFTTKPGGTGLGLSVVFGVVQDHRGSIEVNSAPGQGTTFRIRLPLQEGREVAVTPRAPASPRAGSETILVAEDEPLVRQLVVSILTRLGYTVLGTGDGEEAARELERAGERVDLVLMDVVMPNLGGHAALARMRLGRPGLKAILMSGYAPDSYDGGDHVPDGSYATLPKPFTPAELATKVRAQLDGDRAPRAEAERAAASRAGSERVLS